MQVRQCSEGSLRSLWIFVVTIPRVVQLHVPARQIKLEAVTQHGVKVPVVAGTAACKDVGGVPGPHPRCEFNGVVGPNFDETAASLGQIVESGVVERKS